MAEKRDCDVIYELGCLVVEKDKIIKQLREENSELKRLLRLAVEDIKTLLLSDRCDNCEKVCAEQACHCTTVGQCIAICKWKHAEEAMEVFGR